MQLMPVKSSRIQAVGYDETTSTCFVQFQPTAREPRGTVYAYAHVSPEQFRAFLSAPSIGRFFGQQLADNPAHPSLRLGEPRKGSSSEKLSETPGPGKFPPRRYQQTNTEIEQLERERERLLEFFRPMREATLAAHHAVIRQQEEALAQFQVAEAQVLRRSEGERGRSPAGSRRSTPVSRMRPQTASRVMKTPEEAA